jgi:DNA-binding beta-propeller fold protein YncE
MCLLLVATALSPGATFAASTLAQPAGSEPAASDGQRLSSQSAATQALFTSVWNGQAALEWVKEHNAALTQPTTASAVLPTDFSSLSPGPATCPAAGSTATSNVSTPKVSASRVQADTTNEQLTRTAVPGTEGRVIKIDIMVLDQAAHKLYVADRDTTGVDEFDVSTSPARYVTTFKTPAQPNGVVIAGNRIVAGLCDSTGVSIDPSSGQIVGIVSTGGKGRADELDYDPVDNKVYLANSDDGILSVIDMGNFKIIKQFTELGAALEQPRYDAANGKMYLTSGNGVYEFDPATDTQVSLDSRSTVQNCTGIQINPRTNQGVISCADVIMYDFNEGQPTGIIAQACSGDEVAYSAALDTFALPGGTSCRFGATESFVGGTPLQFITDVPILPGAHSTQIDDGTKSVYIMGPDGLYTFHLPGR